MSPPRFPLSAPYWAQQKKPLFTILSMTFILLQLLFFANLNYLYGVFSHQAAHTHNLNIIFVDYDNSTVGESIRQAAAELTASTFPTIQEKSVSDFSAAEVEHAVCKGDYWAAIYVQPHASEHLQAALQGGSAAATYDPASAIEVIYNDIRFPTTSEGFILPSIEALVSTARVFYPLLNVSSSLDAVNSTDHAAIQALFNPFTYTANTLQPTNQGVKVLYNTVTVVMWSLMQFFFIMAMNNITLGFNFSSRTPIRQVLTVRFAYGLVYSCVSSLMITAYIWIFKESWAVGGAQFVATWMIVWLGSMISFLVLDTVLGSIPMAFVPFFVLSWIITNVAATVMPHELSVGFYQIGYFFPSRSIWEVQIWIWSKGCYDRSYRTLPILFAWLIVMLPLDLWVQVRKCRELGAMDKGLKEDDEKTDEIRGNTGVTESEDILLQDRLTELQSQKLV